MARRRRTARRLRRIRVYNAPAHSNLGILLEQRAQQIVKSGGDLAAAAALYDECAQLWCFSKGADHEWTTAALADAARFRRHL